MEPRFVPVTTLLLHFPFSPGSLSSFFFQSSIILVEMVDR
jgi:hypothetical protein